MVRSLLCWLAPAALLAASTAALAQSTSPPTPADPLDAQAPVPPLKHSPAFRHYRRHSDSAPIDWREANAHTGRIGGWRAYAREAQSPAAPTAQKDGGRP